MTLPDFLQGWMMITRRRFLQAAAATLAAGS
ncbi:twin-arginine translocation signal domain-containing protein, partial [Escherichia coli]|nr:twin-arginine translocation signal domain-containing protein [Escherichia coli]